MDLIHHLPHTQRVNSKLKCGRSLCGLMNVCVLVNIMRSCMVRVGPVRVRNADLLCLSRAEARVQRLDARSGAEGVLGAPIVELTCEETSTAWSLATTHESIALSSSTL